LWRKKIDMGGPGTTQWGGHRLDPKGRNNFSEGGAQTEKTLLQKKGGGGKLR